MPDAAPPIISIEKLCKHFDGVPVLREVSLDIQPGELVSIIGPSGCGKSTLLRCLNGLETLDSGSIQVAGITLARSPGTPLHKDFADIAHRLRGEVGMLFQSLNLFPHLSIKQNVMLAPVVVQGQSPSAAEENAMRLLEKVGLGSLQDRHPHRLSGGQQQRAAIARALALSPKVMLYDEPTSALDPELVDEVLEVMRGLDEEGMTQVVVTHEMWFARHASDRVVYMEQGEIVEIASGEAMFAQPADERTQRFLRKFVGRFA